MRYNYFPGASSVGLWINLRGKNHCLLKSDLRSTHRDIWTLQQEVTWHQTCPQRGLKQQFQQMELPDFPYTGRRHECFVMFQNQGACSHSKLWGAVWISSKKTAARKKPLGSFVLCWALSWVTLLTPDWMHLKENRSHEMEGSGFILRHFKIPLELTEGRLFTSNYLSFLFKTIIKN